MSDLKKQIEAYKEITQQQTKAINEGNIALVQELINKKASVIHQIRNIIQNQADEVDVHVRTTVEEIRAIEEENIKRMEQMNTKNKQEAQNVRKRKENFDTYKKNL